MKTEQVDFQFDYSWLFNLLLCIVVAFHSLHELFLLFSFYHSSRAILTTLIGLKLDWPFTVLVSHSQSGDECQMYLGDRGRFERRLASLSILLLLVLFLYIITISYEINLH